MMATTTKARKAKPKTKPARQKPTWLTLAEAKEAEEQRLVGGVLVDLGPRFRDVGIATLRIVGHDSPEMKQVKGKARRRAVEAFNDGKAPADRVFTYEQLPPEWHKRCEAEVGIESLRGGEGVELHGDFAVEDSTSTAEVQARFGEALADVDAAPHWLVSYIYLAGSKLVSDPRRMSDRQLLDVKKKGYAWPLQRALDSLVGSGMDTSGEAPPIESRLMELLAGVAKLQSTTPPTPETPAAKSSKSTG